MKAAINIQKTLFVIITICLMFNYIPEILHIRMIAGPMGDKLVIYPLMFGAALQFYLAIKYRHLKAGNTKAIRYMLLFVLIYLFFNFISLIHGLVIYPYYSAILNGPANQIEKLPKVLSFLNSHGIDISQAELLKAWMIARPIKNLFVGTIVTFGSAFLIYSWCRNRVNDYFQLLLKGVMISALIILPYNLVEIFYLAGFQWAANILCFINPFIHPIKYQGSWWPPLLWNGQLRSVFVEPSYWGIYCTFLIPLLWCACFRQSNKISRILITGIIIFTTFCLFLSRARTGFILYLGEVTLFICFTLYLRNMKLFKMLLLVVCISFATFVCSTYFISNCIKSHTDFEVTGSSGAIEEYVDSNLKSLGSSDQRSNKSRFTVMKADIDTGLEHPILGVGPGLRVAYISDILSHVENPNHEMKKWIESVNKLGILRSQFPGLGQYTVLFSETGFWGLLIYMVPPLVLLFKMLKKIKTIKMEKDHYEIVFYLISLLGILATGFSSTLWSSFCYWLLLGIGFAIGYCDENQAK